LVHSAHDRLEVVDVERPRIEMPVPSDDVERMVIQRDLVEPIVLLHDEREFALLVVRGEIRRTPDVTLAVRRAFLELAELVAIPLGPANVSAALEAQQLVLDTLVHAEPVE